jgi:hypothetical protein
LGFHDKLVKLRPIFFRQALHTGASRRIELSVAQPSSNDPDLRPYGLKAAMHDRKEKVMRNKSIPLVNVLWRGQKYEEATWEPETQIRSRYPELFDSEDRIP